MLFFYLKPQKRIQTAIYIYTTLKYIYMNKIVPIRLSTKQKEDLTKYANQNHLKLSTWIRQTILKSAENE
jgi:hypothetical protein